MALDSTAQNIAYTHEHTINIRKKSGLWKPLGAKELHRIEANNSNSRVIENEFFFARLIASHNSIYLKWKKKSQDMM